MVHAESGLALECKVGRCGVPHILVGKSDCFTVRCLHTTQKPRANSPRQPGVPLGARAAILLLRCRIVLREARRTRGQR